MHFSRFDLNFSRLLFCYCKKQIDVSFSCVCPVIDNEFLHVIVKVVCGYIGNKCYDEIHDQ